MIAIDTNIVIYYLVRSQPEHARARRWFESTTGPLVTTGTHIAEILRLLTHPRVFPTPLALAPAVALVQQWMEAFQVRILEENPEWWQELPELLDAIPGLAGNELFDARIALSLRYNGIKEYCTLDANFSKYPFLQIVPI